MTINQNNLLLNFFKKADNFSVAKIFLKNKMNDYKKMYKEVSKNVENIYGLAYTDPCVDAENCGVINDNSNEFWKKMFYVMQSSVGSRMAENGISSKDINKLGIYY